MEVFLLHLVVSIIISIYYGKRREISTGWCLFFCLTLSIIIGLVIISYSPRKEGNTKKLGIKKENHESSNKVKKWAAILVGLIGILLILEMIYKGDNNDKITLKIYSIGVGLIGLALYIKPSKKEPEKILSSQDEVSNPDQVQ